LIDALEQDVHIGAIVGKASKDHRIADDAAGPDVRHERIIGDASNYIDIRALNYVKDSRLTLEDLWTGVGIAAAEGFREYHLIVGGSGILPCEPEVDQFQIPVLIQQQILALNIPMHHSLAVDVLHGTHQLLE